MYILSQIILGYVEMSVKINISIVNTFMNNMFIFQYYIDYAFGIP